MDPVSLQASTLGVVRPAIALQADLSAVLREGSVLAGEVLQSFGGGSLLIGIGGHRVPAESQVELSPGHRFLFQVEVDGEGVALRVLDPDSGGEPALLRALRGVLGHDAPLGQLLGDLASALRGRGELEGLVARLEAQLARPDGGGPGLAAALGRAGSGLEAGLAVAAALRLPPEASQALAAELEAWLGAGLARAAGSSGGGGGPSELLPVLRAQLAVLLGADDRPASLEEAFRAWIAAGACRGPASSGAPAPSLESLLVAAARRVLRGDALERALASVRALRLPTLGRGLEAVLLRRLLGLPAAAPRALVEAEERAALERAGRDLKGRLARALDGADGAAREALRKTLSGLEAEQLLNIARRQAHEPWHLSLPLLDGARWTTAHLFVERRRGAPAQEDEDGGWRLTLALDLSRTGPVRVDLLARPGALAARLQVAGERVARHLRAGLDELQERLATGGRRVQLSLLTAPESELRVSANATDVRYLREHHVMDLSA